MRLIRSIVAVFLFAIVFASTADSGASQVATADVNPGGPSA